MEGYRVYKPYMPRLHVHAITFRPQIVFGPVVHPVAVLKKFDDLINQTSIVVHDQLPAAVRIATDTYVL